MNKKDLQRILQQTTFSSNDVLGSGFEVKVVSKPEWDFVVKVPIGIHPDFTKQCHETSLGYLGGLIAGTAIVDDIPLQLDGKTFTEIYVQEKLMPLRIHIKKLRAQHDLDAIEQFIYRFGDNLHLQLDRGCYKSDCHISSDGIKNDKGGGRIVLTDLGFVTRGYEQKFPGMCDINFLPGNSWGMEQRLNQRAFIHYENRDWFAGMDIALGLAYEKATGLDFNPDVDISSINESDLREQHDIAVHVLRLQFGENLPKGFNRDTMQGLIDIWNGKATPQRFSLYHTVIRNKYQHELRALAFQEIEMYFKGDSEGVQAEPYLI